MNVKHYLIVLGLLCSVCAVQAQAVKKDTIELRNGADLSFKAQISVKDIVESDNEGIRYIDIEELKECESVIDETDKPFTIVEEMPYFVGGRDSLMAFIGKHLRYPAEAVEKGIEGRIIIRFVVTKLGKVRDVQVLRGIDPICDNEALRVIRMLPDWIPGKQNKQNVSTYYTIPIIYRLPADNSKSENAESTKGESN